MCCTLSSSFSRRRVVKDLSVHRGGGVERASSRRRSARPIWLGEDRRTFDHIRIHLSVVKDRRINANAMAVYAGLVAHAETGTGLTEPSNETLASYADVSVRTVQRALRTLKELQYIAVEAHWGHANRYVVLPPPTLPGGVSVAPLNPNLTPAHQAGVPQGPPCHPDGGDLGALVTGGVTETTERGDSQSPELEVELDKPQAGANPAPVADLNDQGSQHPGQPQEPQRWMADARASLRRRGGEPRPVSDALPTAIQ